MARTRRGIGIRTLGELDVDVLMVVWRLGRATVKDVFETLYDSRRLAYTTILTVMGRLAKKGILDQDRQTAPFLYTPALGASDLAISIVEDIVDRLLDGSPDVIVDHFLHDRPSKEAEDKSLPTADVKDNVSALASPAAQSLSRRLT